MKLYAYARYSSDNQRSQSIDEQLREINDYCVRKNYVILKSFCDYARSGKFDTRPEFDRMLKECIKDNICDGVIVFDVTRFSRAGELGIVDSAKLSQYRKVLISVTEQIAENDLASKMMKYMKFLMAEEEITKLSNNVKRGKRETALACEWNGGSPPLGYDVINKKLVINRIEAKAVKIIFEMVAKKQSYTMIIRELNSLGYKTKAGNTFKKTSIHEILSNKKYIGVWEYGKMTTIKNAYDKTISTMPVEEDKIITFEDACEPIIDKELWNIVQETKGNRKQTIKAKVNYSLSGKIQCKECGSPYVGSSTKSHGKKDYYYVCSGKKNGNTCTNRNIRKNVLEDFIANEIINLAKKGEIYNQLSEIYDKYKNSSQNEDVDKHNKEIEKRIIIENKKDAKMKAAYLNDLVTLEEFKEERLQHNKIISKLNSEKKKVYLLTMDKKTLKKACDKLIERIDKDVALDLCDAVVVDNEVITCVFGKKIIDKDNVGGAEGG